jgi:hypothetical protein
MDTGGRPFTSCVGEFAASRLSRSLRSDLRRAAVRAAEREPWKWAADLMIAATAASNQLPLYTANPDDFKGLSSLVEVAGVKGTPMISESEPGNRRRSIRFPGSPLSAR